MAKKSKPPLRKKPTINDTNKKAMLLALEKSMGIVTTAARQCGINRSTHYDWYNDDPEYKKLVDDLANVALDFAESTLFKCIQKEKEGSTIFYLKTKGKHRGYIETSEQIIKTPQLRNWKKESR